MYELLGIASIDFTNRETGERIQGFQFWFLPVDDTDRGIGRIPEKKWVSPGNCNAMGGLDNLSNFIGCRVIPQLDLRGRVVGLELVKK